jgi:hypothetical protein
LTSNSHLSRIKTELYFRQILGRILRITTSADQQAWLFTFAEPKLVEFANRIAEEIPDLPVIHRPTFNVSLSEVLSLDKDEIMEDCISSKLTSKLEIGSSYKQMPLLSDYHSISTSKNTLGLVSQSFELLGGFREKVVSTFDSPF